MDEHNAPRSSAIEGVSAALVGGGLLIMVLFPLSIPFLVLTAAFLFPLLIPVIAIGLLVAIAGGLVLVVRRIARLPVRRRERRRRVPMTTARRTAAPGRP